MKLKDLTVGQTYRTVRGEQIIVIDVGTTGNRWFVAKGYRGGIRQGVGGTGAGVAVAKSRRYGFGADAGTVVWSPDVVQASTIEFTEEAYRLNREATAAHRQEVESAREQSYRKANQVVELAKAAGLDSARTDGTQGSPVAIRISPAELLRLLENQKEN